MNKPVQPMSSLSLKLPTADGGIETYRLAASRTFPAKLEGTLNRVAFSAAHVVADPRADVDPWLTAAVDWDRTIAFREHIWDLGLGVAEAMDTAQRGMGLDWKTSLELIRRSVQAAKAKGNALVFSGAGTDHLAVEDAKTIDDVIRAYEEQIAAVEKVGGRIILMASRALAKLGRSAEDYAKVYDRVLSQVTEPVIIHWLGDMFDPALAGYWGTADLDKAMDIAVAIINANAAKVDGVKVSLLDKQREIDMRRRLDKNVKMYTGDDFNYAELIAGDAQGFSHALLGIFDAIAPAASYALSRLAAGDEAGFHDVLGPTVPLSRHIFKAPTRFYKTGIVFMAYLNGHQDHFTMVGGQESARSTLHLAELFRLADKAGLLANPEIATRRMQNCFPRAVSRPDAGFFERSSLAVAEHSDRPQAGRSAANHRRLRAAKTSAPSIPGATRSQPSGSIAPRVRCATPGSNCRAIAAAACSRPTRRIATRRATTTAARWMKPRRWARRASCWSPAGCRNIRGRAARRRRISRRRGRRCMTASPRCWITPGRPACRSRSSRCIRPMPPTAPASTRPNRRWIFATRWTLSALARSASRSTSITSGGIRN